MSSFCVAYGCGKTAENDVTLFRFPKDPEEFRKWEKQVQRTRSNWFASPNCHLCSDHFGKDYFESISPSGVPKLKPGAVPTVFIRRPCLPAIEHGRLNAEPKERNITVSSGCFCLEMFTLHPHKVLKKISFLRLFLRLLQRKKAMK